MRLRSLPIIVVPLFALLAGCETGEVSKRIPISGGGEILVPLTREGIKPGEADGYQVRAAILEPGKEQKDAYYIFQLLAHKEPALSRIEVVDISDEKEAPLIDDTKPKFENGLWKAETGTITADDPRMQWVLQITPSMRVYRFTLTRTDGSKVSFNHVTMYPPMVKAVIRGRWGEKY